MGVGGGGVYLWHRAQARDQAARVAATVAQLNAARLKAGASSATIATLTHRVDTLTSRVNRLRASLARATAPTAACDPRAMLPVIQDQVSISPPLAWGSVTIDACQNGYARVFAGVSNPPPNLEGSELVYLQDLDGTWKVIASGTGLTCSDPEVETACSALGLA